MNKKKFLAELSKCLRALPKEDREDAINYYVEYFDEMGVDDLEDVTAKVGKPQEVAKEIISNCAEKRMDEHKEKGGMKNSALVIWMIILAIMASPIAIPVAIALIAVLLSLVIAVVCTVGGLAIGGIAVIFSGIVSVIAGIVAVVGVAQKFVVFGVALIALALGILWIIALGKLAELILKLVVKLFRMIVH